MGIADGTSQMRKARFVKTTGAKPEVDEDRIERARMLAGLKGYVTNIGLSVMKGQQVIDSYHDLWQVEASFRMTKSDLSARPVFHRDEDAIDAHLSVVFAALAICRHLQEFSGMSLNRIITDLKSVRSAKIQINGDYLVIPADVSAELRDLLARLKRDEKYLPRLWHETGRPARNVRVNEIRNGSSSNSAATSPINVRSA